MYTLLHVYTYICKLHAQQYGGWGGVWGGLVYWTKAGGLPDIVLGPWICPMYGPFYRVPCVVMCVQCACPNDGRDLIVYWSKAGGFICCPMLLLFLTCVRSPISNVDARPTAQSYTILHNPSQCYTMLHKYTQSYTLLCLLTHTFIHIHLFLVDSNCNRFSILHKTGDRARNTEGVSGRGGFPAPTLETQSKYFNYWIYITLET